jgi:hypothetical protein
MTRHETLLLARIVAWLRRRHAIPTCSRCGLALYDAYEVECRCASPDDTKPA